MCRLARARGFAYQWIPGVLEIPEYSKGIFHPSYLVGNLYVMLLQPPVLVGRFPYFVPSLFGMSAFLTTPAWLMTFLAPLRQWRTWVLIAASVACLYLSASLRTQQANMLDPEPVTTIVQI
jgi:hypothetical protein